MTLSGLGEATALNVPFQNFSKSSFSSSCDPRDRAGRQGGGWSGHGGCISAPKTLGFKETRAGEPVPPLRSCSGADERLRTRDCCRRRCCCRHRCCCCCCCCSALGGSVCLRVCPLWSLERGEGSFQKGAPVLFSQMRAGWWAGGSWGGGGGGAEGLCYSPPFC